MAKRVNLYLSEEAFLKLKGMSIEGNTSMSSIIVGLIQAAPEPEGRWYRQWRKEQPKPRK
jgi:hypothetical protein